MTLVPPDRAMPQALRAGKRRGVHAAVVVDNKDGDGNPGYRVKIRLPWLSEQDATFWARIAVPMGGPDRGTYFLPEVGDQVLVVFEHGDIDRPIVIGAVWNKQHQPVEANDSGRNHTKLVKSRAGHRVIFDDKDGAERITIVDRTKQNKIVLDSAAKVVKIECAGDIELKASANVIMHAKSIKLGAQRDVSGKATQVLAHTAATLGVKAASQLAIDGANVTINVTNSPATQVSGEGRGSLGGEGAEQAKSQVTERGT